MNYGIFKTMPQIQKNFILNKIYYGIYPGDKNIYNENDISYCIYFIKEGEVEIKHQDIIIETLGPGEYFGLLSILNKSNRIFDAIPKSKEECKLKAKELLEQVGSRTHFTNEMLRHSKWKDARVFMVTG